MRSARENELSSSFEIIAAIAGDYTDRTTPFFSPPENMGFENSYTVLLSEGFSYTCFKGVI